MTETEIHTNNVIDEKAKQEEIEICIDNNTNEDKKCYSKTSMLESK